MAVGAVFASNVTSSSQRDGGLGKDLQGLQKALAVGNVSGAQQAFTQYKKDLPTLEVKKNGVEASTRNNVEITIKADLAGLQNALSAGDISGAQDAFVKLKQDLRKTQRAEDEEAPDFTQSTKGPAGESNPTLISVQAASGGEGKGQTLNLYA